MNPQGQLVSHDEDSTVHCRPGPDFLKEIVAGVVLKEVRRKIPGMYTSEMAGVETPRRIGPL